MAEAARRSAKPELQLLVDWLWNALAKSSAVSRNALAQTSGYPKTFIYDVFDGRQFPSLEQARDLAQSLGCPQESVEEIWHEVKAGRVAYGRLPGVWDPFVLGVHQSIECADGATEGLLPAYVEREHDRLLRNLMNEPARNLLIVVTGNACTGKTRTALESVRVRLPAWPLVCPIDNTELTELVASRSVQPRTVLWLDEMQVYLQGASGERAAAAVRRVVAEGECVLVIGTMWISHWNLLTSRDETSGDLSYPQAGQLLNSALRIGVPDSFSGDLAALALLERLGSTDSRLVAAKASAERDGRVIQTLAGGIALVSRYEQQRDEYSAVAITAAMDIRRLGHYGPIPRRLLEEAIKGSLTPAQRVTFRGRLPDALKLATAQVRGVRAITPQRNAAGVGQADSYVLHDYLDQYARQARWRYPGHTGVWQALAEHTTDHDDRKRLAAEASSRALFRLEAILLRPLAALGDLDATRRLAILLFRAGHRDEAIHLLRSGGCGSDPESERLHIELLEVSERWDELLQMWKDKATRGEHGAIAEVGVIYEKVGEPDEAIRWLERALAEHGDDTRALRCMSRIEEQRGRLDTAINLLRRGIAESDCEAVRGLMELLERQGRITEAESVIYDESIGCSCYDEIAELANLQIRAGVLQDRVEWWRKLASDGDFHEKEMAREVLVGWIKEPAFCREAIDFHEKRIAAFAETFGPGVTRDHTSLLRARINSGTADQLLDEFTSLAADGDKEAMVMVADILTSANRIDEAETWLHAADERGFPTAWRRRAELLQESGRTEEAMEWIRSSCLAGHDAIYALMDILEATGNSTDASQLWSFGLEPDGRISDPW